MTEYNFDGLVGPTHNYGGLSPGNLASEKHGGDVSNPREAALQGLAKMKFVAGLGVGQAVLPPHPRPSLSTLRSLGFSGTDEEVITRAASQSEHLLRLCSSGAAMWTANAATCAPSSDTSDGRAHFVPANLNQMFHRAIEAETTWAVLSAIFSEASCFQVHRPLPGGGQFADEGAANHTRLHVPGRPAVHVFAWGRSAFQTLSAPARFPARQTLEASQALARLLQLDLSRCMFPQQAPEGIDAGAFHTDVLAVGNGSHLLLHERAFVDVPAQLAQLGELLGEAFTFSLALEKDLRASDAVAAYPFNSQLLTLANGKMALVSPKDSEQLAPARQYLDQVAAERNPVEAVHYLDLRQSMNNGGGPACLRLRVSLTESEVSKVKARVFYSAELHASLEEWVTRHYRDRLTAEDLKDPAFARETMVALDALTGILRLGSVYDFQTNP